MSNLENAVGRAEDILDSITDGFYLLDGEWRFRYVNRQGYIILGRVPGELVGKSLWEEYPGLIGSELENAYHRVAFERISQSFTFYFPDHERWYEVHSYPSPEGMSVYFRNATEQVLAEKALRESEMRFRSMADAVPQIIWITDGQGNVEFFNQQWYRYTGNPFDLKNAAQVSADYVHPEDHATTMAAWEAAGQAGTTFTVEHRIRSAAGEYRWFLVRGEPYRDPESGQVVRWYGTSTDIHDKRLAENSLLASEQRLRLLDAMSEATRNAEEPRAIMRASARLLGEFLNVTRCAYASVEIDNDTFTIHDDWSRPGTPTSAGLYSLDLFGPKAAADMRGGRTLVVRDVDRELAEAGGADMFNAIGIQAIICCPLVKGGKLVAMMAVHEALPRRWTAEDISLVEQIVERSWAHIERVRATEALRDSEAYLSSLFEQTAAGVALTDLGGKMFRANQRYCEILGRSREDIMGRRMQELTHPEDLPHNLVLFERMAATGEPFTIEKRYLRPDGAAVWVSVTVNLVRSAGERTATTVFAVVLDISERKRAEFALREQDRRKDDFLAMLAHELRNPLAPISAAAALMQMVQLDAEHLRQTSEIIDRQVRHMTGLIDDLMDVSRVTRGLISLNKTRLDVKRVIYDAVEQADHLIQSRGHRLNLELASVAATVFGDHKRLVQILANLLNNSAKYTPEGGDIRLGMDVREGSVLLCVTDNGIGIAPELQPHIFELFIQGERGSDRSQGGLGIGLALVKSLVELHDGEISCRSEGLGRGSCFTVALPRIKAEASLADGNFHRLSAAGGKGAEGGEGGEDGKLRILVVDDNADAARMLSLYLQAAGHDVMVEHGARQAVERARSAEPDVCILDIGLPEMDGNEVARQLRSWQGTRQVFLIALTGYGQEQDREIALASGFDHHLVKPVDTEKLRLLMDQVQRRK